ncbi:MAG TPA: c-type cytochrome [Tepidisphaeraceae bacterium]|jgi:putative heme-binding domain-containing protein
MIRKSISLILALGFVALVRSGLLAAEVGKPAMSDNPTPNWVWSSAKAGEDEVLYFRKSFELPNDAQALKGLKAQFWGSCDNVLALNINGQFIGFSTEWTQPVYHDLTTYLRPGKNVIAIKATNQGSFAGLIARLMLTGPGTARRSIVTDDSWRWLDVSTVDKNDPLNKAVVAIDYDDSKWKPSHVLGKLGIAPWGMLEGGDGRPIVATPADTLQLLPGFKADLLYTIPKTTQGSWVAMCVDPKGRLITSDQTGYLYRVTVGATAADTKVERINQPIGHAQGLLCAFDALYVVVNGAGIQGHGSGLYRLTDTDGDDQYDKLETLARIDGAGEHGPHAIRLGPDGKSLYLVAGNFTKVPQPLNPNSPHRNFAEDHLLIRNPDGGGHDPNIFAPGGWLAKTDKDAKEWTLVCAGMRNTYDFAFNADGEILNYDSDMEWDTGTPWYRPIRVLHLVSGGEYGWRNGTGKWPAYYPDSLGAVVNTGMGSPVGVTFGYGTKFPAKYQQAFFIEDWAYGKIYAVHLTPSGSSYTGTFETFVAGKGFPVTDIVVGKDGTLYVTTGGRGTQSGLYRISYVGNEPTSPVTPTSDPASAKAREERHRLESFHGRMDPAAISAALPYLNSTDRNLRYAARIALEWQPIESWKDQVLAEKRPTALINGMVGLIRADTRVIKPAPSTTEPSTYQILDPALQPKIIEGLNRLNLKSLTEEQLLEATRAYGLAFIRLGKPDAATAKAIAARFDPLFPSQSIFVNREVAQLLVYLQSPGIISKCMEQLAKSQTQEDQLYYCLILRNLPASTGWTLEQRRAYFSFINFAQANYKGGASFRKFLSRIREDATKTLSDEELKRLDDVLKGETAVALVKDTKPRQFVRNWATSDLVPEIDQATHGRNYTNGKAVFESAQCAACHRFANEGGSTGPDLSGVGNRFSPADVLESILLPSKVISDQYQTTVINSKDGDTNVGRIAQEDDRKILLQTNPLSTDTIEIAKKDVKSRGLSKVSMMPQGLVDYFEKDDILDLVAYLRSGGDAKDKAFAK